MLDFRYETFLSLCKIGNYTKTAEALHITQPAVTQHIKYLEKEHGKLFYYKNKKLTLTIKGEKLRAFVQKVNSDISYLNSILIKDTNIVTDLYFGATLSIGEYVMPEVISSLDISNLNIHMEIDNTSSLLEKLDNGEISFAIIEGFFDKNKYGWKLFSEENFIGVCSPLSPLAHQHINTDALLKERIILREIGSGTRDIFETTLYENNLSINSFNSMWEISNMNVIKNLVAKNLGITFLYEVVAKKELKNSSLKKIYLEDFNFKKGFYFIYLKNSLHESIYNKYFQSFIEARKKEADISLLPLKYT